MGDFSPGNGIVAQALLSVSDVPPRFIDPGSLHSRTAGGAPCSSRRSASLHRPLGALGFGPTGRARLRSPQTPSLGSEPSAPCGIEAERALWDRSRARPVGDEARRSIGNCKERPKGATMHVPRVDEARRSIGNRKECRLRHDYASFPGPRTPSSLRVYGSLFSEIPLFFLPQHPPQRRAADAQRAGRSGLVAAVRGDKYAALKKPRRVSRPQT